MRFTFCKHGINIRVKFNAALLKSQATLCELGSEDDSVEYLETPQWSRYFGGQSASEAQPLPTRTETSR